MTTTNEITLDEQLKTALEYTLKKTHFPKLGIKYEGKVRDNYTQGDKRFIIVTDRISAFDRVLGTLPLKGQVLNTLAGWWFDKTKSIAANHMVAIPDPNVMEVIECVPLPVEMIMRAYITGVTSTSIWTHYNNGEREFCGHRLPEGLKKHQKLEKPILTPSTKADKGDHDVSASREEILAMGRMSAEDFDEAARMAKELFAFGQKICAERGLILVDTKYEFGITKDGKIIVIDEIHTPDSSRFWYQDSYQEKFETGGDPESFDKEYVRRWLADQGFTGDGNIPLLPDDVRIEASKRYIQACEQICGEKFVPDLSGPNDRMQKNLA